jgi:RHS repeat-associated protein
MPLAVATPDGSGVIQLNWVHGNHLGVPLVTTDASGNTATTLNDYLAPGFPGQSRTLADLYYNRYRDYDPTTGRYVQVDPIGLAGGQNGYVYAANNPIRWTDPEGLFPAAAVLPLLDPPVAAAIGIGVIGCALIPSCRNTLLFPPKVPDCSPWLMNDGDKPYAGETPADKPDDFERTGWHGKKAPPKRKSDGSIWEGDVDGHGGSGWKRWPSGRDWERDNGRQSVRPDGSVR